MNCEETQLLLHAYIDAELDVVNSLAVEQHLKQCAVCSGNYKSCRALCTTLRESSLYFQAPASLQKHVELALPRTRREHHTRLRNTWPWLSAAALFLLLLSSIGFWAFVLRGSGPSTDTSMAQAVVDSHERSLVDDHLADVLSSDPDTIKTWFESKLGFSPPVINLTPQGYSLIGGRMDFLDNQTVAAIVYKRGDHVITLFAWPAGQNVDMRTLSLHGYDITHWTRYGMNCWAVADLGEDQMQQFARLINQHIETFL